MGLKLARRNFCIATGSEGSFGSGTLHADNIIRVIDIRPKYDVTMLKRNSPGEVLDSPPNVVGSYMGEVEVDVDLKGSGTAGTPPPDLDVLLKISGLGVTNDAGVSDTYAPIHTSIPVADIAFVEDGLGHELHSCRANARLSLSPSSLPMITFTIKGVVNVSPNADSLLTGISYTTIVPPAFKGVTSSIFSVSTLRFTQVDFDFGNELAMEEGAGAATGFHACDISDRNPTVSVNPQKVAPGTFNPIAAMLAGTLGDFDISWGATAGNIISINCGQAQIVNQSTSDRNGLMVDDLELELKTNEAGSAGSFNIVFT